VAIQQQHSFPVGKVEFLQMYPMGFAEFLEALNQDALLEIIATKQWLLIQTFHDKLIELLRLYYFIGGMPEAVQTYINTQDLSEVSQIHQQILAGYTNDFAKYAPITLLPRIQMVWQSILPQLAKENKKFIFGQIKKGARANDFDVAITWLLSAGLLHKCTRINKVAVPISNYAQLDVFKLFLVDLGLLGSMAKLTPDIILNQNTIMQEFKGAFTEQYVLQQLFLQKDLQVHYWASEAGKAELDFVVQNKGKITAIEVKAEENLKAKSLKEFVQKYAPHKAIRYSMSKHRQESWMENVPLYSVLNFNQ
jgi:uncharacterized protein